ncbi:MAG: LD-carboxypeptidase [bacterium]|nr:LD-carboxypeptidase [bacterium]
MLSLLKPKHLRKGDTVGIVSSSAPLAGQVPHRVERGITMLRELGFDVRVGKHALEVTGHTAGGAKERAEDIHEFFRDKNTKAIFSFIGGNHSNQLLKYLDFDFIRKNPKVFIGFSDATVLHFALYTQARLISFYGPAVLTQFADNPVIFPYTLEYFEKALMDSHPIGEVLPSRAWTDEVLDWFKKDDLKRPRKKKKNDGWQWIREGEARGPILGGCITSMMHLRGTEYWPDFSGSILFWEIPESERDFARGESVAIIDAYLTDLELMGLFGKIKGMVIGRPFGYTRSQIKQLIEIIRERTSQYRFPVLFNVDIGHTDPMITIPLGVRAKLDSSKQLFVIEESGVE